MALCTEWTSGPACIPVAMERASQSRNHYCICRWSQQRRPVYVAQPQWCNGAMTAASASLLMKSCVVIQIRRLWWV